MDRLKGRPWKCRPVDAEENQRRVFHRAHRTLEIAARFPHSHRLGWAWKSGKPKAGFPLSHLLPLFSKPRLRKEAWQRSLRSRLQAHSSMRKCSGATHAQLASSNGAPRDSDHRRRMSRRAPGNRLSHSSRCVMTLFWPRLQPERGQIPSGEANRFRIDRHLPLHEYCIPNAT